VVLEGVNHHHITESVDPKDVESSQGEKLGPFYKRTLPYHETATDTSLVMLRLELDKQASTIDGETLHSIVEGDIGKYSDLRVVAIVAPSGSGKTATVVDLASKHFVI
jgi:flagellar biosynthesis GTPase FlhF